MTTENSAVCPFFCEIHGAQYPNKEVLVKCEAPIDIKSLFMTFSSPQKKREYVIKYCCAFNYVNCSVAHMLLSTKYNEGAD